MLLALTRRGNYTGKERIKGKAVVHGSQKKRFKGIIGGGEICLDLDLQYRVLPIKLQDISAKHMTSLSN